MTSRATERSARKMTSLVVNPGGGFIDDVQLKPAISHTLWKYAKLQTLRNSARGACGLTFLFFVFSAVQVVAC
jgi:hypothetical protein